MDGNRLKPGDRVVYIDRDRLEWGPWTVVEVSPEGVTVRIAQHLTRVLPIGCVRKADLHH